MTNPLSALKRRLEKAELVHLRNHAGELASRLELAEDSTARAWEAAEMWREDSMQLMQDLIELGATVGMTKAGEIGVIRAPITPAPCAIGEPWPGTNAIYAGISLDSDNTRAVHLILWPEVDSTPVNHAAAIVAAKSVSPEHNSHLPTRTQYIALHKNLKTHFDETTYYWSSTKTESGKAAFTQDFDDGYQIDINLSAECRVRAVSEIPL